MGNSIPYGNRTLTDQARAYLERLIEVQLDSRYIHDRYDLSLVEAMTAFKFGAFYMMDQMRSQLYDKEDKPSPFVQQMELTKFVNQLSADIGIYHPGACFLLMDEAERYEALSKYLNECLYDIDEQRLIELGLKDDEEVDSDER